jgi:hypothetical protein
MSQDTQKTSPAEQTAPHSPSFSSSRSTYTGKAVNFSKLTPNRESEPPIAQGIDLAGQPKIVFAVGRGRTGKTTLLRWLTETSVSKGGTPILADIDPSNASFSQYFSNIERPETDEPAGVVRWLQTLIEHCIAEKQSAIIDLGGGDTTLRTLATEMPGLADMMENEGIHPVVFHLLTTAPEDLTPTLTLTERGFSPKAQAYVFNEFSIEAGKTRGEAFQRLMSQPDFMALKKAGIVLWMPTLFAAEAVEARQCHFFAARDGKVPAGQPPLGPFDRNRLRIWLETMDRRFAGIGSWIP